MLTIICQHQQLVILLISSMGVWIACLCCRRLTVPACVRALETVPVVMTALLALPSLLRRVETPRVICPGRDPMTRTPRCNRNWIPWVSLLLSLKWRA